MSAVVGVTEGSLTGHCISGVECGLKGWASIETESREALSAMPFTSVEVKAGWKLDDCEGEDVVGGTDVVVVASCVVVVASCVSRCLRGVVVVGDVLVVWSWVCEACRTMVWGRWICVGKGCNALVR